MAFNILPVNIREGIRGLEHLRLAACRRLFNMKPDHFMQRYAEKGVKIEIYRDFSGKELICKRCGFVMLKASLSGGWTMQTCSAFPIVKIEHPDFHHWLTSGLCEEAPQSSEATDRRQVEHGAPG